MTENQEKIASEIIKYLQSQKSGYAFADDVEKYVYRFYDEETKERQSNIIINDYKIIRKSLLEDYQLIYAENGKFILRDKGRKFKSFRKIRRKEFSTKIMSRASSFWFNLFTLGIAGASLLLDCTGKSSLNDLQNRIEKLENSSKPSDTGSAPMRQEIDSTSKHLEAQQNQGIQEK